MKRFCVDCKKEVDPSSTEVHECPDCQGPLVYENEEAYSLCVEFLRAKKLLPENDEQQLVVVSAGDDATMDVSGSVGSKIPPRRGQVVWKRLAAAELRMKDFLEEFRNHPISCRDDFDAMTGKVAGDSAVKKPEEKG